ncbi:MAG: sulfotransferase [Thiobacillaceae bacterium]
MKRPAQRPIIVVGCSRAGTTLVYKTLSESHEIGSLQRETHDFWVDLHPLQEKNWNTHGLNATDANPLERDIVSRYFYARTGHHRWVDKNNQNGLCVPYLHALFPDAVFVYVKRSPGDNINSLIEGWGKPEEFATWSDKLPAKVDIDGRYKKWCFFLADGWRAYLGRPIEEICAFQYQAINQAILDARQQIHPDQWVEVFYEDFLRQPVETFRQVFERCGLYFDQALERHCAQVLDIPYNAFSEIRLDKWKDGPNREKVARAVPMVGQVAGRMGYALT